MTKDQGLLSQADSRCYVARQDEAYWARPLDVSANGVRQGLPGQHCNYQAVKTKDQSLLSQVECFQANTADKAKTGL